MKTSPLIRETKPEDLLCRVTAVAPHARDTQPQFTVDNNYKGLQDWDREYVSFGGYFGTHGPHVFAAAPELLAALVALSAGIGAASLARNPYGIELRAQAAAAIAKATGK